MRPFEKYKNKNNIELAMFPLEYLYITQGEDGAFSHKGTYAIDFAGRDFRGTVTRCPYYAPFDMELVAIPDPSNHAYVYTSLEKVQCVTGDYDYVTILVAHDDDSYQVGRIVYQGGLLGKTGTYGNVTGDHVHMEIKLGTYNGLVQNQYGIYMLRNSTHIWLLLGCNDTIVEHGLNYDWRLFSDVVKKKKFPWFIYYAKYAMEG